MTNKKKRLVCERCGEHPVWTTALRHRYNYCPSCSIGTACSNCGTGIADPRLIWRGRTYCEACRALGHNNAGAIGRSGEPLAEVADRLRRFRAEVGGTDIAIKKACFDTIREAREWAESRGASAEWCSVYRGDRLVAQYRRTTSGDTKWYKVASADEVI